MENLIWEMAFYSGTAAKNFGFKVKILTSFGKDLEQKIKEKNLFKKKKIFKTGNFVGAGDVFVAAFLIKFKEIKDCFKAAQFANSLASRKLNNF